jgi:hypothetical protein
MRLAEKPGLVVVEIPAKRNGARYAKLFLVGRRRGSLHIRSARKLTMKEAPPVAVIGKAFWDLGHAPKKSIKAKKVSSDFNTAQGEDALFSLTTGVKNTAIGFNALYSNTIGSNNTTTGLDALVSNTSGFENTVIGASALRSNTAGSDKTAIGASAFFSETTGHDHTAIGHLALFSNTDGNDNTAMGEAAL